VRQQEDVTVPPCEFSDPYSSDTDSNIGSEGFKEDAAAAPSQPPGAAAKRPRRIAARLTPVADVSTAGPQAAAVLQVHDARLLLQAKGQPQHKQPACSSCCSSQPPPQEQLQQHAKQLLPWLEVNTVIALVQAAPKYTWRFRWRRLQIQAGATAYTTLVAHCRAAALCSLSSLGHLEAPATWCPLNSYSSGSSSCRMQAAGFPRCRESYGSSSNNSCLLCCHSCCKGRHK